MDPIKRLLHKHRDVLLYLIFGVLTTLVNFLVYYPLYHFLNLPAFFSNIVAWIVAVAFAFVTNKPFVFGSHDWSWKVLIPELGKFVTSRLLSGALETLWIAVTVDILLWHAMGMKVIASIGVVIFNYVASRWFVFKKK